MNRLTFFNMNFNNIFFIIFLNVIVRQCESDIFSETHFIFMRNMVSMNFIHSRNWNFPTSPDNPDKCYQFCESLKTLPIFTSTDMTSYQSNFVNKVVSLDDKEIHKQKLIGLPFKRDTYVASYHKNLNSILCKWNYFNVFITKNVSAEEYLLYFSEDNKKYAVIDEPLTLIVDFFNMKNEDADVEETFRHILMKEIRERTHNNVPLPPLVYNGKEKLASSRNINYWIFTTKLCASSFLYTLGAKKLKNKKIDELKLDISIDEVTLNALGITLKNKNIFFTVVNFGNNTNNNTPVTVVKCTCNNFINLLVPYHEDKKKLFIVSNNENNKFSWVSLDFSLDDEHVPNN